MERSFILHRQATLRIRLHSTGSHDVSLSQPESTLQLSRVQPGTNASPLLREEHISALVIKTSAFNRSPDPLTVWYNGW